jgi:outer membrane protein assembly factor BamE (lipoprotein component of BamABCDE complex)
MDDGRDGTPANTRNRGDQSRALGFRPGSHDVRKVIVEFDDGQKMEWAFNEKPAKYRATSNHRRRTTVKTASGIESQLWTGEYYDVEIAWTVP